MRTVLFALTLTALVTFGAAACAASVMGCTSCADTVGTPVSGIIGIGSTPTYSVPLNTICTACSAGFFMPSSPVCTALGANCLAGSSLTVCTLCASGYFLAGTACASCGSTTAVSTFTGQLGCLACTPPATGSTVAVCTSCNWAIGYQATPASGVCVFCLQATGATPVVTGCATCSPATPTVCNACTSTQITVFTTPAYACATNAWTTPITNCFTSTTPATNSGAVAVCAACGQGYFMASTTSCVACFDTNCAVCSAATTATCTACKSGYVLNTNICVSCATGVASPVQGSTTATGFNSGCTACTIASNVITCTACASGLGAAPTCTNPVMTATTALPCGTNCATCLTATIATCLSCNAGFALQANATCQANTALVSNCWIYQGSVCVACAQSTAGSYYGAGLNCTACAANCGTCTSATACTVCSTGFNLSSNGNGSCLNVTAAKSSTILVPGMALLSMIFYYLF